MPKTSVGRKKLDSKHKREFKQREKGRQVKKNKSKTQLQNMYVDKLKKITEQTQKIKEDTGLKLQQRKLMKEEEDLDDQNLSM